MKKYEEIIHSRLRNEEMPIPSDLWSKIDSRLDEQEPKSRPFFWIILSMLCIVSAGGIISLYYTNTSLNSDLNKDTIVANNDNSVQAEVLQKFNSSFPTINEKNAEKLDRSNHIVSQNTAIKEDNISLSHKYKPFAVSNIDNNIKGNDLSSGIQEPLWEQNALSWIEDDEHSLINQILPSKLNIDNNNTVKSNRKLEKSKSLSALSINAKIVYDNKSIAINDQLLIQKKSKRDILNNQECLGFANDQTGLFLEAYYNSEMGLRRLEDITGNNADHLYNREQSEKASYSYSYGIRANYAFQNSMYVKSGFNFTFINETMQYNDPDAVRYQTVIKIDSMLVDNTWQTTRDTTQVPISGLEITDIMNRYRTIDIPIMVGYQWDIASRWSAYAHLGAVINLKFNQSGSYLSSVDSKPVSFNQVSGEETNIYKNKLSTSFTGGVGIKYRWTRDLSIFAEPQFRYFTGSFTTSNYVLNQSYTILSLSTGVQFKF